MSLTVFSQLTDGDVLSHHCQPEAAGHLVSSGQNGGSLGGDYDFLLLYLRDAALLPPPMKWLRVLLRNLCLVY